MVCDSGEKCFAPTLVVGVGADWLGCIQGARCLWVAIRAKNISPLHWMVVLGLTVGLQTGHAVLLVAFRAKNISPLHWLVVLRLTGSVVNRECGVNGLRCGRKIFRPYINLWCWGRLTGLRTGYAVVMACDTGEKYFAPTLIGGVGAYESDCEQGMRCLWFAIGAKNILSVQWVAHLAVVR